MVQESKILPTADGRTGLDILLGLIKTRSLLTAIKLMHQALGDQFQITMPVFQPAVFTGSESNREILVEKRDQLNWRSDRDPVTKLLRRGLLVVDGEEHDFYRKIIMPSLQMREVQKHVDAMWQGTGKVTYSWKDGDILDMLVEMRKVALIILMQTLFRVDISPDINRLWEPILSILKYISPGIWILWPDIPRFKYNQSRQVLDDYLYSIIQERRKQLEENTEQHDPVDLLSILILSPQMTDDLIRDQLLTLFIAGHDTSTALLAWALYLLASHPEHMSRTVEEVDNALDNDPQHVSYGDFKEMHFLEQVIQETLRLYPPIHVGNRKAVRDMTINGYSVTEGSRVMCSIYLSHNDPKQWDDPGSFKPQRFDKTSGEKVPPLTYIPFGAGPRNCIGAVFARVEAKVVLARLLSEFNFELMDDVPLQPYMGATLEPSGGVKMRIFRRGRSNVSKIPL